MVALSHSPVIAGLDPAIHLPASQDFEMDGRLKGGHDMRKSGDRRVRPAGA